jgi:uncharacterized DUF497 family protein
MKYEWDSLKAFKNIQKHGIDFAGAVIALEDEYALTIEDGSHNVYLGQVELSIHAFLY